MTHETEQEIRRRPDGSIDTSFYLQRGRDERSKQAHAFIASGTQGVTKKPARLFKSLKFWNPTLTDKTTR